MKRGGGGGGLECLNLKILSFIIIHVSVFINLTLFQISIFVATLVDICCNSVLFSVMAWDIGIYWGESLLC